MIEQDSTSRDMERVMGILEVLFKAAYEAAQRNAHKGEWVGLGYKFWQDKINEEDIEATTDLAQRSPKTLSEVGDLIWCWGCALDDSGMLKPPGTLMEKEEEV